MNPTVALIDSLSKIVGALPDVLDVSVYGKAVHRNLLFDFKNGTNCTPISPARTMRKDSHLKYTDLVCDPHQIALF